MKNKYSLNFVLLLILLFYKNACYLWDLKKYFILPYVQIKFYRLALYREHSFSKLTDLH